MTTATQPITTHPHDLRWFVWTIMFLLTTGVLLVTYITYVSMTDETLNYTDLQIHRVQHNAQAQK